MDGDDKDIVSGLWRKALPVKRSGVEEREKPPWWNDETERLWSKAGRLKKIVSAWVGLDAVFCADSEYHIKKNLKNGLGGEPFQNSNFRA